jgi:hypothetical protein
MHDGEDPVTEVKIDRMKAMGPDATAIRRVPSRVETKVLAGASTSSPRA